ncbi:MAG: ATP-binding protein [Flavobacteriaceae bacterium]
MPALHDLKKFELKTIQSFIDNEIEESINIEFKSSGAISRIPKIKKEISKDVSAFANSDGGIIIYGIEEKNHKAYAFSYIDGNDYTKEFLEQVINSTIKRAVSNIKIHTIRAMGDIAKSIYVVQIPSSVDAPHMNQDNRYYRRYNFESIAMEEYEVRQLYGRILKSKLNISKLSIFVDSEDGEDDKTRFTLTLGIENIGEVLVKEYRANVYFEGELNHSDLNWEAMGQGKHYSYTVLSPEIKFTNENSAAIFPSEVLDVLKVNFDVKTLHIESFLRKMKIRAKLFWENESVEKKYDKQDVILSDFTNRKGSFSFLNH